MRVWSKLITALRGSAHELGEAVVDTQALRILDQEIRDADEELKESKKALAEIMAKHTLAKEKRDKVMAQIAEYESYAKAALDKGDEPLALEVAEKIAAMENQLEDENQICADYERSVEALRETIAQADLNIRQLKQQVDTVKATENVQKAQATVAGRYSGNTTRLMTARESLDRLRRRQAESRARMEASIEMDKSEEGDALDAKLANAGIRMSGHSAQGVIDRLRSKKKS